MSYLDRITLIELLWEPLPPFIRAACDCFIDSGRDHTVSLYKLNSVNAISEQQIHRSACTSAETNLCQSVLPIDMFLKF